MALCFSPPHFQNLNRNSISGYRPRGGKGVSFVFAASGENTTKLVTFIGKGGSGKTTAAALAAQYYAKEGLQTCFVVQSQDTTAEHLMGCKIGTSPSKCAQNLSVIRLETIKMILGPLNRVKKADARINSTQGILEGVVGEELGILPGMDSIFAALEIEKLINFLGVKKTSSQQNFDVVVYDGNNTEEILRVIGAAERARQYLKYARNMAEKTDIGRLASPSILKLASETMPLGNSNDGSSDGKTSTQIWDNFEHVLMKASASFTDSSKFRCYLVIDPSRPTSLSSALRYWGCAIQAGTEISGAFAFSNAESSSLSAVEDAKKKMSPLPTAIIPNITPTTDTPLDWNMILEAIAIDAKELLNMSSRNVQSLMQFDESKKTVTLFLPGFDKSEIKLYQYRGGSELLVEAGDQRRVIRLPTGMQGKVSGAKFAESSLVVSLK